MLVGPTGARGLVSGDNSTELQLDFLTQGARIYAGDEVYTSGSDGVLPRGLRVGVVTGSPGSFRVLPYAELNSLDAVSVLFFDAPALTRTDPPVAAAPPSALSAPPEAAASATALPVTAAVENAGASALPAGEGHAQAEQ